MKLNDTEIVVAIENAVCDQLEASGITADPFRLDGEKIVQVILDQLGDYVLVPREPTEEMIQAGRDERRDLGTVASTYKAMIEAVQESTDD
ncbi:hypothetical protein [Acinetobacter indicus]|uniref:hypothetical protein n=1 Tax=Acinetobacter indicus TaxID=756892 RepID=UPI000948B6FB|nr:hypothetical protein [Acinetobacter indicus]RVT36869.1 hypothetical protein ENC20_04030 [Acinetobacter indicus]